MIECCGCLKLGLDHESRHCSIECFKAHWGHHKAVHEARSAAAACVEVPGRSPLGKGAHGTPLKRPLLELGPNTAAAASKASAKA